MSEPARIAVVCGECGKQALVDSTLVGQSILCRGEKCGALINVTAGIDESSIPDVVFVEPSIPDAVFVDDPPEDDVDSEIAKGKGRDKRRSERNYSRDDTRDDREEEREPEKPRRRKLNPPPMPKLKRRRRSRSRHEISFKHVFFGCAFGLFGLGFIIGGLTGDNPVRKITGPIIGLGFLGTSWMYFTGQLGNE